MAAISSTNLLPLLAFITTFHMLILNKVNSQSFHFEFPDFGPSPYLLRLEGNATIDEPSKTLRIPKLDDGKLVGNSVGRAYIYPPVPLASFVTTFRFNIKRQATGTQGDGLTFFVASRDHPLGSAGGYLGLVTALKNSRKELAGSKASSDSQFVAVEFDTYVNKWDPAHTHVGIDVNSIVSANSSEWGSLDVYVADVQISYSSVSKTLTAVVAYPFGDPVTVSHEVDLEAILPEHVIYGFTGSTGDYRQLNQIISWYFTSTKESSKVKKEDLYIASVV